MGNSTTNLLDQIKNPNHYMILTIDNTDPSINFEYIKNTYGDILTIKNKNLNTVRIIYGEDTNLNICFYNCIIQRLEIVYTCKESHDAFFENTICNSCRIEELIVTDSKKLKLNNIAPTKHYVLEEDKHKKNILSHIKLRSNKTTEDKDNSSNTKITSIDDTDSADSTDSTDNKQLSRLNRLAISRCFINKFTVNVDYYYGHLLQLINCRIEDFNMVNNKKDYLQDALIKSNYKYNIAVYDCIVGIKIDRTNSVDTIINRVTLHKLSMSVNVKEIIYNISLEQYIGLVSELSAYRLDLKYFETKIYDIFGLETEIFVKLTDYDSENIDINSVAQQLIDTLNLELLFEKQQNFLLLLKVLPLYSCKNYFNSVIHGTNIDGAKPWYEQYFIDHNNDTDIGNNSFWEWQLITACNNTAGSIGKIREIVDAGTHWIFEIKFNGNSSSDTDTLTGEVTDVFTNTGEIDKAFNINQHNIIVIDKISLKVEQTDNNSDEGIDEFIGVSTDLTLEDWYRINRDSQWPEKPKYITIPDVFR